MKRQWPESNRTNDRPFVRLPREVSGVAGIFPNLNLHSSALIKQAHDPRATTSWPVEAPLQSASREKSTSKHNCEPFPRKQLRVHADDTSLAIDTKTIHVLTNLKGLINYGLFKWREMKIEWKQKIVNAWRLVKRNCVYDICVKRLFSFSSYFGYPFSKNRCRSNLFCWIGKQEN